MKKYIIISIDENTKNTDGHIIIVKANEAKEDPMFDHLSKMFGKKYYTYQTTENPSTEWFVYPYSNSKIKELMSHVKQQEDAINLWDPNMSLFYDAQILLPNGDFRNIHKSIEFQNNKNKDNKKLPVYIPPVDFAFRHKMVKSIKCIVYPATQAIVMDKSDGSWSWQSGDMDFFIFPDNEVYNNYLNEATKLEATKREFWIPKFDKFDEFGIEQHGPFGSTKHNLYVSTELPVDILIDNINQLLQTNS